MPRFPKKEAGIVALAEPLRRGLLSNISVYPKPPINPIVLRMKSLVYKSRCEVPLVKKANAETATTAKDDALEDLIKALKSKRLIEGKLLYKYILENKEVFRNESCYSLRR